MGKSKVVAAAAVAAAPKKKKIAGGVGKKVLRPLLSKSAFHEVARQAGFTSVQRTKPYERLNNFLLNVVHSDLIEKAILASSAEHRKSLRRNEADSAIAQSRLIPSGHFH